MNIWAQPRHDHRESARVYLAAAVELKDPTVKTTHLLTAITHLLMSIDDRLASQTNLAVATYDERDWPGEDGS
jgi:hypothetical protein